MTKSLALAIALLASIPALAAEKVLTLHLECGKATFSGLICHKMTMTDPPGATFNGQRKPIMTLGPTEVQSAQKSVDEQTKQQVLSLHLSEAAAKKFAHITKSNVKKRLAIVLDKEVLTAPVIQTEIAGGNLQITAGT